MPGGANGVDFFKGTLVSSKPGSFPDEFLVAVGSSDIPEATLKLKGRLAKPLSPGTPITFQGVATAFTADPFMLTFEVQTVNRAAREDAPGKKGAQTPKTVKK